MVYENAFIKKQYPDDKNLDIRIKLHQLYSTNKQGWPNWVFDQVIMTENMNILELGCGNANFWVNNGDKVPKMNLFLTDVSKGMIEVAQKNLVNCNSNISFSVVDAQNIPFKDDFFDIVIANHMIYHIPDINRAIKEMYRVLKPNGQLYATTMGQSNMDRLYEIVKSFDENFATPEITLRFGLETGEKILNNFFDNVEVRRYIDSLNITETAPLLEYIKSLSGVNESVDVVTEDHEDFKRYLDELIKKENGLEIKKDSGILIATK